MKIITIFFNIIVHLNVIEFKKKKKMLVVQIVILFETRDYQ